VSTEATPTTAADLGRQVEALTTQLKATLDVMEESKATDSARWDTANTERVRLGTEIGELKERFASQDRLEQTQAAADEVKALLEQIRTPSLSGAVGRGRYILSDAKPYKAGDFIRAVFQAGSRDAGEQTLGKASMVELGIEREDAWGKATLGDTDAAGGWIVPNAVVAPLEKPAPYVNPYRAFISVVPGVTAPKVDLPYRGTAVARAVVAAFGSTKENVNLAYDGYTLTMHTMARIYDLGKQFVRQSAGAAEADVMQELQTAHALGEAYYIISGAGTTEPFGLWTALSGAPGTFTSAHTPSATTLAGSVVSAIATCAGDLALRNRGSGGKRLTAVVNAGDYWTMLKQGTDTAGFFFAPAAGPQAIPGLAPGTLVSPFGIPVIPDSNLTADRLIVGEFDALKLYVGENFRVDTTDVAGTRWDANLIGFRGEQEIGLDARAAVAAGAFQRVTNLIA